MSSARPPLVSLWHHRDFRLLLTGQSLSQVGSQVTFLALPLTAAIVLQASPSQMGILGAAEFAPFLLWSLFAGVLADRAGRQTILVLADVGRAIVLGAIPIAAFAGVLRIEFLYAAGFLIGTLTVFFNVAYQAYLPVLVEKDQLAEANAKLEISRSVAQVPGPGVGGALVQALSAPFAILVDSVSFLLSAVCVLAIRRPEPPAAPSGRSVGGDIREGLDVIVRSPFLRAIALCTATSNLFDSVGAAVYVLYVSRTLSINPLVLGTIYGVGSLGALAGAFFAERIGLRFGIGPTVIATSMLFPVGAFIVVATESVPAPFAVTLILAQAVVAFCNPVYNVSQISLRQAITPLRLQGRMNATMRFIGWGTIPIGSLLGGFLGELVGLRTTLLIAAIGASFCFAWVLFSPVRGVRTYRDVAAESIEAGRS